MGLKEQEDRSHQRAVRWRAAFIKGLLLHTLLLSALGVSTAHDAIAYSQSSWLTPSTSQTSVAVNYSVAQIAGDLNVIAIGWEDSTHQIQSVTDTKGNVYAVAASSRTSGSHSLAIYYAKNIIAAAAGANTVTVTFNGSTTFPDIRILEYSGVDTTNPLDVSVGAGGNSTALNSGSVTTTNANDLLDAANEIAHTTNGTDSNFTQRLQTDNQNIIEDRIVTATGSYS